VLRWILPRPDSGEGKLRFGVRLLVAALCAAALLQAMRPAVFSARQGFQIVRDLGHDDAVKQLEYIGTELHRQIPAGKRAQIVEDNPEWRLRVTELATQQGIVVVDGGAQVEVRLQFDQAAPHGVRVLTREVGG
jgi:hypothetical protein